MHKNKTFETIKSHARRFGIFANIETIGCYDDFSQIVMLDYLDRKSLLQIQKNFQSQDGENSEHQKNALQTNFQEISKFYSTCVHELTHWLDHTSTLWGQRQLILIYNAIHSWTNQKENDFHRIATAYSERGRARLGDYYTENYSTEPKKSTEEWRYQYSSGVEFGFDGKPREDRPFICTIFLNSSNQRIIRVPFSMFSLTEANATYSELKVKSQIIASLNDDVETNIFRQEVYQNLYNPELAIYSVATHCLANTVGIKDTLVAYEFSSTLAIFCLNLPRNLFSCLIDPHIFSPWGDRVKALKEIADPGFAFFTITQQAPKYRDDVSVQKWLQEAIKNSGLPSLEIINDLVLNQMEELRNEIIDGVFLDDLMFLLNIGMENFIHRGIWGQNVLSLETLEQNSIFLPPIVLADESIISIFPNTVTTHPSDIKKRMENLLAIELRMDKFIRACRL
jgi:hypothetical protein